MRDREEEVAARCYKALFVSHPHLTTLFDGILEEQHKRLGHTLAEAVIALDLPAREGPDLARLGRRHTAIGVKEHHHRAVAAALLVALADMLGTAFTTEVRDAWAAFYATLQHGMAQG